MYFPLKVSIPEPCHEDWNKMTPVEFNQRHCRSCDRVLTDFSTMTDVQIGSHLRRHEGQLCGRFRADQLDRKIATGGPRRFTSIRAVAAASGLLLSLPSFGQGNAPSVEERIENLINNGEDVLQDKNKSEGNAESLKGLTSNFEFRGVVLDENGEPLIGTTIAIAGTSMGTVTNLDGYFSIPLSIEKSTTLVLSFTGYFSQELHFTAGELELLSTKEEFALVKYTMKPNYDQLEEVVIVGGAYYIRHSLAHRIFIAPVRRCLVWPTQRLIGNIRDWREERRATRPERQAEGQLRREERQAQKLASQAESKINTASKPSSVPASAPENNLHLTASPNPFTDHLNISFDLDDQQSYTLELFTAQGKTVTKQLGSGEAGKQNVQLHHQISNLPAGTYYLHLVTAKGQTEVKPVIR